MPESQEPMSEAAAPQRAYPAIHVDKERRLAGKIASAIDVSGVAYFVGFFLALGMNLYYFGVNAVPAFNFEGYKPVLAAVGWALLSWLRVGWLLMEHLGMIALRGA